jgi:hypothetical protein
MSPFILPPWLDLSVVCEGQSTDGALPRNHARSYDGGMKGFTREYAREEIIRPIVDALPKSFRPTDAELDAIMRKCQQRAH